MRPTYLKMTAFGPFAGEQTLAMDRLGEKGLYAITGETGAGKTTIFDAIMFALYNCGSGADRDEPRNLRSKYADDRTETSVELTFETRGERYTIVRKPAQYLRGNKTEQPGKVALTLPDGGVLTKEKDVARAVEEIIGVDARQFEQIVMIAQGQFRELLRADSREREKIFRNIFKTERYDAFQLRLKEEHDRKEAAYQELRQAFVIYLKQLDGTGLSDEDAAQLRSLRETDAASVSVIDALTAAQTIAQANAAAAELSAEALVAADRARLRAEDQLREARTQAERKAALNECKGELAVLAAQRTEAEAAVKEAEGHAEEAALLQKEISVLESRLPEYRELDRMTAELALLHRETAQADRQARTAEETAARLDAQLTALEAEAAALADAKSREANALIAREKAAAEKARLVRVQDRMEAVEKAKTRHTAAVLQAAQTQTAVGKAQDALRLLTEERAQLGNTAQALTECRNRLNLLAKGAEELKSLSEQLERYKKETEVYLQFQAKYVDQQRQADMAQETAMRRRREWNGNMAGILAGGLAEGKPCPVCGSVHHPAPAEGSENAPTQEMVNAAEEAALAAQRAANRQAGLCNEKAGQVSALKKQLAERLPGVDEADWALDVAARTRENTEENVACREQTLAAEQRDRRAAMLDGDLIPKQQQAAEQAAQSANEAKRGEELAAETCRAAESELAREAADVLPEAWTQALLKQRLEACGMDLDRLEKELERAKLDERRLTEVQEKRTALSADRQAATEARQQADRRQAAAAAKAETLHAAQAAQRARLPFPSLTEAEATVAEKRRQQTTIEQQIRSTGEALARLNDHSKELAGRAGQLEKELAGRETLDLAECQTRAEEAAAMQQAARQTADADAARSRLNSGLLRRMQDSAAEAEQAERAYRTARDLYYTVSGRLAGTSRVSLETYVQAAYFERILRYANLRLYHMSRHQFEFRRRSTDAAKGTAKVGLDLDVIDHANGTVREVSTLSGGESFLAALALALGMSDELQNGAAAAVQLDAMFVDEGFGSLSDEFLRLAMDELKETAESGHRLIGVISHIEDVKNEISRRIEVTKRPGEGSTARLV